MQGSVSWVELGQRVKAGASVGNALGGQLGVSERIGAKIAEMLEGVFEFVRDAAGGARTALDDETQAIAAVMRLAAPVIEGRLQKRLDALDAAQHAAAKCPTCSGRAHSVGKRGRGWKSLAGRVELSRRMVECAPCEWQFSPAQRQMMLGDGDFTPRMEEVCTLLATTVPHEMAVKIVGQLTGATVSEYGVQQMVERRGKALEVLLHARADELRPYNVAGLPRELPTRQATPPNVAYLEIDGVIPMTREELTGKELGQADKARQRRAKTAHARGGRGKRFRLVGREVKNAVLYSDDACATESPSRGCLLDKRYVSHLGDSKTFAGLVWVALRERGYDRAGKLVLLSDGADWIRSLAEWLPVPVKLILDLFHVKHRIWEVANSLFGEHTDKGRVWAHAQCARVEDGRAAGVIQALRFVKPARAETKKLVAELATYLRGNLDRMDYPAYRAAGLRVGSGAVESANYHVTGARLKLQGMRWSEAGAREMALLRADLFNGQWEAQTRLMLAS